MILELDISWPEDEIPLPFVDYSGSPRNATILSQVETPNILRRSRFERSYNGLKVSWVLTTAQFQLFRDFYADDLGLGNAQFSIPLRYPKNTELTSWAARFAGTYDATRVDGMWQVQASLDLVNPIEDIEGLRLTEDGQRRVTEAEEERIIE